LDHPEQVSTVRIFNENQQLAAPHV